MNIPTVEMVQITLKMPRGISKKTDAAISKLIDYLCKHYPWEFAVGTGSRKKFKLFYLHTEDVLGKPIDIERVAAKRVEKAIKRLGIKSYLRLKRVYAEELPLTENPLGRFDQLLHVARNNLKGKKFRKSPEGYLLAWELVASYLGLNRPMDHVDAIRIAQLARHASKHTT
jgi:hypothetical protein